MGTIKIVICDNDEDELMFATVGFNASGLFEVAATKQTGEDLLNYLQGQSAHRLPHIILTDLNMPGLSGFDLLLALSKNKKLCTIPVYVTSTSATQSTIDKCLRLGAKSFLKKPDLYDGYHQFAEQLFKEIHQRQTRI